MCRNGSAKRKCPGVSVQEKETSAKHTAYLVSNKLKKKTQI